MTFWKRYRRGIIWIAVVAGAFALAFWLSSCGVRPQPMGENVWRAL